MNAPTCYFCRKHGHTVFQCVLVPPCLSCGKKGHKTDRCRNVVKPVPQPEKSVPQPEKSKAVLLEIDWDEADDEPFKFEKLDWVDEKNW